MPDAKFSYSENFLQWLWKQQLFEQHQLYTEGGVPVTIIDPGIQNHADGPDFLNATIQFGSLQLHGAIELHVHSGNWYRHGHQTDSNYKNVILHVVAEDNPQAVLNQQGVIVPTLNLLPSISSEVHSFFEAFNSLNALPCTSQVSFISKDALLQQIEKAHEEYFQKKVDDFFKFYNPELVPSQAWKEAMVISLFDGLGISHNRQQMQEIGRYYLQQKREQNSRFETVLEKSEAVKWNLKGVRQNNHPRKRVKEGILLSEYFLRKPVDVFLTKEAFSLWEMAIKEVGLSMSSRYEILQATVFIPAIYALGTLFGAHKLSEIALQHWINFSAPIPKSLLKKYASFGGETHRQIEKKLGAVYQLRTYCNTRRCQECEVLKKAISS